MIRTALGSFMFMGMAMLTAQPPVTILTSADPGWDDARRAWNLAVDQHPAAVATSAAR